MFGKDHGGFNAEAYQQRLEELKQTIEQENYRDGDFDILSWSREVSLRYGQFLARNTSQQLDRAVMSFGAAEHVADKQKHREYCAAQLMGVISGLHAASAMIRGSVVIADPVGAEAMMRIYDEANRPPGTKPAPMTMETDLDYRWRIRERLISVAAALDTHADPALIEEVNVASGHALDALGRKYHVLRAAAPTR